MAKTRIFIACSGHLLKLDKSKGVKNNIDPNSIPVQVAKSLRKLGKRGSIEVKAWWEEETIPPQSKFFDLIRRWARDCDLGVFILSKEHELKSARGSVTHTMNANVLLELGLSLQSKGDDYAFAIPEEGTEIPSDQQHKNWRQYNFSTEAAELLSALRAWVQSRTPQVASYAEHQLHVNKELHRKLMNNREVAQMGTKALYLGRSAAQYWRAIEADPKYKGKDAKGVPYGEILEEFVAKRFKGRLIDNVISFGPGTGSLDKIVVGSLRRPSPRFIPIDINSSLAMETLHELTEKRLNSGQPTAIVDDFETHLDHLHDLIQGNFNLQHHQTLFMMMGGTFGNIEDPANLLTEIGTLMSNGDRLLMDVYLRGKKYNPDKDFEERSKLDGFHDILVNAIRLKARVAPSYWKGSKNKAFRALSFDQQKMDLKSFATRKQENGATVFRLLGSPDELKDLNPVLLWVKRYEEKKVRQLFAAAELKVMATSRTVILKKDILLKKVFLLRKV